MPAEKRVEYAIQATASVWEPLEQMHYVVSGNVDFDSFGMAPWDAGMLHGYSCQLRESLRTMMLQWLVWLLWTMRMNKENGLYTIKMTKTNSPRLAVTPGEWYASDMLTQIRRDLRQINGIPEVIGAMYDCRTVWGFPRRYSTAVDCDAVDLDDLTFSRKNFSLGMIGTIWMIA